MYRPCMINRIWSLKQHCLQVTNHAWFHLHGLRRAAGNGQQAKNSKWEYISPMGIEPACPRFPTGYLSPLGNRDRCYKCMLYLKFLKKNQQAAMQCIKLIRCVLGQTVTQNLHFFFKYRCYLRVHMYQLSWRKTNSFAAYRYAYKI